MIRYLIKNNFKIMFRSVTNILLLLVAPLLVSAVLESAFSSLLEHYEQKERIDVGYQLLDETMPEEMMSALIAGADQNGLHFALYETGEPEKVMRDNGLDAFVVFADHTYTVYQSEDSKKEGKVLEYVLFAFFENASGETAGASKETVSAGSQLKVETPDFMPAIDSKDYYGIIEIIYFCWCAIVCGASLFSNEKKYRIGQRFRVSGLTETKLYAAKFIPTVMVVGLGMWGAALLSHILLGVHWGNIFLSGTIILFSALAAVSMGLMFLSIFDNVVISIILVFSLVWFAGFFGGSFETYMFSAHPESLKLLSPLYHSNRALVELSCMGHSDYVSGSLLYSAGITVVCSAAAILAGVIRKRGKA